MGANGKEWVIREIHTSLTQDKDYNTGKLQEKNTDFQEKHSIFWYNSQQSVIFSIQYSPIFTPFSTKQHEIESFLKHTNSKNAKTLISTD